MMTSKEWAIHKKLNDTNPIPIFNIPRGTAKSCGLYNYIKIAFRYFN